MGHAAKVTVVAEPLDHIGDARRMDLQALADLAQRELPLAGELEQHQHLVAGEREAERLEFGIDS
jgi:hypothetical protein